MNDSVGPVSSGSGSDPDDTKVSGSNPTYKEQTASDDNESHNVMGMDMDKKQYDMFMKNLSDSVIDQIKKDEAEYNQTQQQIREEEQQDEGG